jgi:hypothetical protein
VTTIGKTAAALIFALWATAAGAQSYSNTQGQNAGPASTAVAAVVHPAQPVSPHIEPRVCEFEVDVSRSTDPEARLSALTGIAANLAAVLKTVGGCDIVRMSAFSSDPLPKVFEVSVPAEHRTVDCDGFATTSVTSPRAVDMVYPTFFQARVRRVAADCRQRDALAGALAAGARQRALANIAERLLALHDTVPTGNCTAIYETTINALRRSDSVVLITDVASTCGSGWPRHAGDENSTAEGLRIPSGKFLLFVVFPPKANPEERLGYGPATTAQLDRVFPGVHILPFNEATLPSVWSNISARSGGLN